MQRLDFLKLAVPKLDDRAKPTAPKNTEQWCWHCCHPFPTAKVVLPVSYDDRRDIWKFAGAFCSWSCAKGYSRDHRSTWNNACGQLLTLMHKKTTGRLTSIVPAPPRACLAVFGGTMSIDEFRAKAPGGVLVTNLPPRMIPIETIYHERKVESKRILAQPGPDLEQRVAFESGATATKNETLRLKRPKPMPSTSDVLARTMGLEIK